MEVSFKVSEDILIANITGEIDHHTAAPLRNTIDESMQSYRCRNLVMDLTGVDFMDSSGIGLALGRYKKLAKIGGKVCVCGCSEYLEKVLEMAGVFTLVSLELDVPAAVAYLKGQQQLYMEV